MPVRASLIACREQKASKTIPFLPATSFLPTHSLLSLSFCCFFISFAAVATSHARNCRLLVFMHVHNAVAVFVSVVSCCCSPMAETGLQTASARRRFFLLSSASDTYITFSLQLFTSNMHLCTIPASSNDVDCGSAIPEFLSV